MQKLFEESKKEIVEAVQHGVRLFDPEKKTALTTDWSKTGTGFSLLQQHCKCPSEVPDCCGDGWKLVFAGSQFNTKAEANYSPVEGEALAVVKALHKARYFVLGCADLIVVTDHKPLLKLLGNRKLEEIFNPRLLSLKEKTLIYRFKIVHIPGRQNKIPDAASRYPSSPPEKTLKHEYNDWTDIEQTTYITAMSSLAYMDSIKAVTWDRVREETASDPAMVELYNIVQSGFNIPQENLSPNLTSYYRFREYLSTIDGVLIYKNRVVIPPTLRPEVLENLHSAHQGVTSMNARAESSVFWPNITADINNVRSRCFHCDKMAPSQPSAPPVAPVYPDYPFQMICGDYCLKEGTGYLVIVDRYSGWPVVTKVRHGEGTSKYLIAALKNHCSTYGIPEELSSDGGSQLDSKETTQFLAAYGIRHRISSVAYPHSNCRAELGVKTIKRLLTDNTGPGGSLDTDKVLRALLQYTPDHVTGMSPAQVVFGRQIRDFTPVLPGEYQPRDEWRQTMQKREDALSKRHMKCSETLSEHTRSLPPLKVSDTVIIQNQVGNHPRKWDKTGKVVEVKQYNQYIIKVDGSGRTTLRNRKFLRKYTPFQSPVEPGLIPTTRKPYLTRSKTEQLQSQPSSRNDDDDQSDIPATSSTPKTTTNSMSPQKPALSPQQPVNHPVPQWINIRQEAQNATPSLQRSPIRRSDQRLNGDRPVIHSSPEVNQNVSSQVQGSPQPRRSSRKTKLVDRLGYAHVSMPGGGDNAS